MNDSEVIAKRLMPDERVLALFLFGSQARGQAGPLSDVDLAVLLSEQVNPVDHFDVRLELMAEVSSSGVVKDDHFDLVIMNEATPALALNIYYEGTKLFVKDEQAVLAFLERSLDLYLDFEPYAKAYDRRLRERIRKGSFGGR
jgi:predicted nucleotidyltransferase